MEKKTEKAKVYTYLYNKREKMWEKFSLTNLCSPKDELRKQRETIVRDFIDMEGLPYTVLRPDMKKAKYQIIRLMPSELLIVAGSGMSVALLSTAKVEEMTKKAKPLDLAYSHFVKDYLAIYPNDQKKRWMYNGTLIMNQSKKNKNGYKTVDKL